MPKAVSPDTQFRLYLDEDKNEQPRVELLCKHLTKRAFINVLELIDTLNSTVKMADKADAAEAVLACGLVKIINSNGQELADIFTFNELLELLGKYIDRVAGPATEEKKRFEPPSESRPADFVKLAQAQNV